MFKGVSFSAGAAAFLAATLVCSPRAEAKLYTLSQTFAEGALLTFDLETEDLNKDGRITYLGSKREVLSARVAFTGNSEVQAFSIDILGTDGLKQFSFATNDTAFNDFSDGILFDLEGIFFAGGLALDGCERSICAYLTSYTVGGETFATSIMTVNSVPEPASWAMMIAGFGLLGALARRRPAALGA